MAASLFNSLSEGPLVYSLIPKSNVQPYGYTFVALFMVVLVYAWIPKRSSLGNVPIINPIKGVPWQKQKSRWVLHECQTFLTSSKDLLAKARSLWPNQLFRINTDLGEILLLPPAFADEIRNEPKLSLSAAVHRDFHGDIPGFDPTALGSSDHQLLQIVARKQLSRCLAKVTKPLSTEAALALTINLGESKDWSQVVINEHLLDIIARISSRVFLGDILCRNEDWLYITKSYTISMFIAVTKLRLWPESLRKLVHWFLPECQKLRKQLSESRRIVGAVIEERREVKQAAIKAGKPVSKYDDAIDWAEEEALARGVTYDAATFQLILSLAAIHTTTDLTEQVMLDLAQHQDYFKPLREEISQVLHEDGWRKSSLYNLRLLDSVIKESQRKKPISLVSMRREVLSDFCLSNGLHLQKGQRLTVDSSRMWDTNLHENPDQWDGRRFLELRSQPGKENLSQLVATSADHIAFGHGEHACPGRFFAANEVKVALCHLLMKYDWKLAPGSDISPVINGLAETSSSTATLLIRRRETMEIDIDSVA